MEFLAEVCLPASVLGPVESFALARFAVIWADVAMNSFLFGKLARGFACLISFLADEGRKTFFTAGKWLRGGQIESELRFSAVGTNG